MNEIIYLLDQVESLMQFLSPEQERRIRQHSLFEDLPEPMEDYYYPLAQEDEEGYGPANGIPAVHPVEELHEYEEGRSVLSHNGKNYIIEMEPFPHILFELVKEGGNKWKEERIKRKIPLSLYDGEIIPILYLR